jgi:hypothetical protein
MKRFNGVLLVLGLTGCTSWATQQEIAAARIRLTINPAEVAGCQSKGLITGISNQGFTVLHGGDWLADEVIKRGGNTILLPPTGIATNRVFGSGEAYRCPAPEGAK